MKTAYRKQIETTTWAPPSGGPSGKFFLGTPLVTGARDVGLRIGAGLPEKEAGFVLKSYEEMDVLRDCDALIYSVQADGKPTPTTQALLDHKLWKGVPAVKAGRAFPSRHFVMANYTFAIATVDEIEGMLKKMKRAATPRGPPVPPSPVTAPHAGSAAMLSIRLLGRRSVQFCST
ncbi:hypothetical protein ACTOXX_15825 [Streptomyces rubiginosohelvolus]|uniref:hypothetical protein n=1 Tax=Streptomyces rubiginosohelvolus TaxID=67362 RepID=UPI003F9387B0